MRSSCKKFLYRVTTCCLSRLPHPWRCMGHFKQHDHLKARGWNWLDLCHCAKPSSRIKCWQWRRCKVQGSVNMLVCLRISKFKCNYSGSREVWCWQLACSAFPDKWKLHWLLKSRWIVTTSHHHHQAHGTTLQSHNAEQNAPPFLVWPFWHIVTFLHIHVNILQKQS